SLTELKKENDIEGIIDRLPKDCYEDFLIEEYGVEEAKERLDNIQELRNKAVSFKNTYTTFIENDILKDYAKNMSAHTILSDFLYEIALVSSTDDLDDTKDKLTLMSLHASKGLEYDTIYLTGMNEGVFPSYQAVSSEDNNDIEEERRLCYVGITRARKHLYLSSSRRRMQNGSYNTFSVSRFVDEIDDSLISKNKLKTPEIFDNDYSDAGFWDRRRFGRSSYGKKYIGENKKIDGLYNNTFAKKISYNNNFEVSKIDLKKNIDSYKMGENIVKESKLSYEVGDRVTHIKFGDGIVKKIEDIGRDYEVTVDFDEIGTKVLFATFAKLQKI
ncbi:MAG: ATP-binding domain-containing protein, partial [Lachnospiraceae bacterium]|nr:ATP-binding domain-containing protein [Lachnospiraceae bacterium]